MGSMEHAAMSCHRSFSETAKGFCAKENLENSKRAGHTELAPCFRLVLTLS